MVAPLKIDVYDKDFVRRGRIGAPKFATVIPRHNKVGSATVGLLSSDRMVPWLHEDGARMVIQDEEGQFLMSGRVNKIRGRGPARQALIEFDIEDDFAILSQVLG